MIMIMIMFMIMIIVITIHHGLSCSYNLHHLNCLFQQPKTNLFNYRADIALCQLRGRMLSSRSWRPCKADWKAPCGQLFLNTFSKQLGFVWVSFQNTTFRKWWSWIMVGNHHCWYMITSCSFLVGGKHLGIIRTLGWRSNRWASQRIGPRLKKKTSLLVFHQNHDQSVWIWKKHGFQKRYIFLVQGLLHLTYKYLTLHGCGWEQPYCCCPSTSSPFFHSGSWRLLQAGLSQPPVLVIVFHEIISIVAKELFHNHIQTPFWTEFSIFVSFTPQKNMLFSFNAIVLDLFEKNTPLYFEVTIPFVSHTLKLKELFLRYMDLLYISLVCLFCWTEPSFFTWEPSSQQAGLHLRDLPIVTLVVGMKVSHPPANDKIQNVSKCVMSSYYSSFLGKNGNFAMSPYIPPKV